MNRTGPLGRHDEFTIRGLGAPWHQPLPTTVLWRWRWEAGAFATLTAMLIASLHVCGPLLTIVIAILALSSCASWRVRNILRRRLWVVIVQHRIRSGCIEAGLHGRSGRPPAVCWTRPVPAGEEVQLWLPAGVTVSDIEAERERLASACWARGVRVRRHRRYAHLASVLVQRWDVNQPSTAKGPAAEPGSPAEPQPPQRNADELYRPAPKGVRDEASQADRIA